MSAHHFQVVRWSDRGFCWFYIDVYGASFKWTPSYIYRFLKALSHSDDLCLGPLTWVKSRLWAELAQVCLCDVSAYQLCHLLNRNYSFHYFIDILWGLNMLENQNLHVKNKNYLVHVNNQLLYFFWGAGRDDGGMEGREEPEAEFCSPPVPGALWERATLWLRRYTAIVGRE